MPYKINWDLKSAHIVYSGNIDNEEIKRAHYEVNNDIRFSECTNLVLDIMECNMDNVEVPKLIGVAGLDIGNLKMRDRHKITMLAKDPDNIKKAENYIRLFKKITPKIKLFNSLDDAIPWLNSNP